jgi:hypothetical protein
MSVPTEEEILKSLFDLHGSLIKDTVHMKTGGDLVKLLEKFETLSNEIQDYFDRVQSTTNSKELEPLFQIIGDPSTLSDEARVNCKNWTIMMFETYPTVINRDHMMNLQKNASTSTDGVPAAETEDTDEDETMQTWDD